MTPLLFTLLTLFVSMTAGIFGALLGLGGGFIVVPALTLLFDIDIRYAIGASIVAVIATSSGSAANYLRERVANMRLAMLLETATTAGAISGAWLAGMIGGRWLYVCFGLVLLYGAAMMYRGRGSDDHRAPVAPDPLADRLRLHGAYYDEAEGREVRYSVGRTRLGLALSYVAGIVSGLLTGARTPFSGRIQIVGKSPLTHGWADSNSGGSMASQLRRAGYDALLVRGRASETGIALSEEAASDLPGLSADRRLLIQAMLNLASNAIKFERRSSTRSMVKPTIDSVAPCVSRPNAVACPDAVPEHSKMNHSVSGKFLAFANA